MRERAYEDCRDWCVSRGLRGEVLDTWPVSDVDPLLRDYGQHLFRGGAAVGEFKRVLFAIQDRRRELRRGVLSDAWGAVSKWEQKEPSDPHVPLPRVAHSAGLSLCVLWSRESPFAAFLWLEMLRALVLGWVALARPAEKLRLLRRHLLLPSDLCDPAPVAFVVFALPKGRWSRRAPKTEHVRIDDADAIAFLERTVGSWPPWTRLFPYLSVGDRYRKVWDALFGPDGSGLGFPCRDGDGLVPASVRAGAGCELYARTADPTRFSWLARHLNLETARRYLQESAAALAMARVAPHQRERIRALADAAPFLLASVSFSAR